MQESNAPHDLDEGNKLGYGNFNAKRSKCINVLLVGRSQTGKSTIVQTILNPHSGTKTSGFSDTRDPLFSSIILTNLLSNESYQLNIIDTPGLKEVRKDEENRADDELLKLASKCVEEHITSLNVVCFVSTAGKTQTLDLEAFAKVKDFLGEKYSNISMMVITHCDEYADNDLDKFEQDISTNKNSKSYFQYCKLGILRYGAIDFQKLESHDEDVRPLVLNSKLKKTEKLRNNFLSKIISCSENEQKVVELQHIYDKSRKALENEVKLQIKQLQDTEPSKKGSCVIH